MLDWKVSLTFTPTTTCVIFYQHRHGGYFGWRCFVYTHACKIPLHTAHWCALSLQQEYLRRILVWLAGPGWVPGWARMATGQLKRTCRHGVACRTREYSNKSKFIVENPPRIYRMPPGRNTPVLSLRIPRPYRATLHGTPCTLNTRAVQGRNWHLHSGVTVTLPSKRYANNASVGAMPYFFELSISPRNHMTFRRILSTQLD